MHKARRAITQFEHERILAREPNSERHAFYELLWHTGVSQGDIAKLHAEDIDKANRVISFQRSKTRWRELQPASFKYGRAVEALLEKLPQTGPLFPYLATVRSCDRATEFKQRCNGLGISGVTLHSYRYAWAERAKSCGYPERSPWPRSVTTQRPFTAPTPSAPPSRCRVWKSMRCERCNRGSRESHSD